ncbi:hypothetical protein HK101_009830 [Irineochytrium annulatum]|nr:hypothetical protein HK101_009830 [Irineochytrium annulatum]
MGTDVFGHVLPNLRILADIIAKNGFNCVVPDILNGDPISFKGMEEMMIKPTSVLGHISQFGKQVAIAPGFVGWMLRHPDAATLPSINAVLDDIKTARSASKIGVIGYCFGGRYCVLNGAATETRVDAFAGCHPSNMTIPKDIEAIGKPGLFCLAEKDWLLSEKDVGRIRKIVEAGNKDVTFKTYAGTHHGFASRGREEDEAVRKARDQCIADVIDFFKSKL